MKKFFTLFALLLLVLLISLPLLIGAIIKRSLLNTVEKNTALSLNHDQLGWRHSNVELIIRSDSRYLKHAGISQFVVTAKITQGPIFKSANNWQFGQALMVYQIYVNQKNLNPVATGSLTLSLTGNINNETQIIDWQQAHAFHIQQLQLLTQLVHTKHAAWIVKKLTLQAKQLEWVERYTLNTLHFSLSQSLVDNNLQMQQTLFLKQFFTEKNRYQNIKQTFTANKLKPQGWAMLQNANPDWALSRLISAGPEINLTVNATARSPITLQAHAALPRLRTDLAINSPLLGYYLYNFSHATLVFQLPRDLFEHAVAWFVQQFYLMRYGSFLSNADLTQQVKQVVLKLQQQPYLQFSSHLVKGRILLNKGQIQRLDT